jgi:hypothetical protein
MSDAGWVPCCCHTLWVQWPPDRLGLRRRGCIWLYVNHPELEDRPVMASHTAHLRVRSGNNSQEGESQTLVLSQLSRRTSGSRQPGAHPQCIISADGCVMLQKQDGLRNCMLARCCPL